MKLITTLQYKEEHIYLSIWQDETYALWITKYNINDLIRQSIKTLNEYHQNELSRSIYVDNLGIPYFTMTSNKPDETRTPISKITICPTAKTYILYLEQRGWKEITHYYVDPSGAIRYNKPKR